MSAITAERQSAARTAERRAGTALGRTVLAGNATAALWYWPIILLVTLTIGFVELRLDAIDGSIFLGVALSVSSYLFVMGIIMSTAYLAVHVAAGGTRRAFAVGTAVAGGVTALGSGVVMTLGLLVERLIFQSQGWPLVGDDLVQLYDEAMHGGAAGYPLAVLVTTLSCATYFLTGACVGMAYYRWGGWRGTAALPLVLLPVLVAELSLQSGYFGDPLARGLGIMPTNVPFATLGSLVAIACAFAMLRLITRTIAIRPIT